MPNFNVHHLGHIPFNPDLLLDRNRLRGRPAGFSFNEITKMYWTVKSFNVTISIISFNEINALETFVTAGGTSGGIIGATAGLGAVQSSIGNQAPISLAGYTKIITKYSKKVRKKPTYSIPFEGINSSKQDLSIKPTDFDIDEEINPNILSSQNLRPNEGSLCSAGPVHRIQRGNSLLLIDFSDIIYFQRKYWPKIEFLGGSRNLAFTFDPFKAGNVNVNAIGGINFLGNLIPVIGYSESFSSIPTQLVVAFGSIQIGKRCCDRFYWDGADEDRANGLINNNYNNCIDVCGSGQAGVFMSNRSLSSTTNNSSNNNSNPGFVGGGGQFGGGGASATF